MYFTGCTETDGMLSPQLIPDDSVRTKYVTRVPNVTTNYFEILKKAWVSKPRVDIVLTKDGTPVVLTKVAINSGLVNGKFRIKYKEQETQTRWQDYVDTSTKGIKVHEIMVD